MSGKCATDEFSPGEIYLALSQYYMSQFGSPSTQLAFGKGDHPTYCNSSRLLSFQLPNKSGLSIEIRSPIENLTSYRNLAIEFTGDERSGLRTKVEITQTT
mgnify:CR=1 FL=1